MRFPGARPRLILIFGVFAVRLCAGGLDEIAAQPQDWPAEVMITAATKATLLKNGAPAGAMLLGKGNTLVVWKISAEGVTGRTGAVTVLVPAEKTDLAARIHTQPAAVAVAPAPATATKPPPAAPAAARVSRVQRQLAGKLVRLNGDTLQSVDAAQLSSVKYYGLYFSASWCGPCRRFTPQFVKIYREMKQRYPEFEVVFISADRSAGAMRDYMREDQMPWLALKYDEAQRDGELRRYCGPGIPCLVLVAADGRVLSDSFEGDNYVGPGKVLDDTSRLLAKAH